MTDHEQILHRIGFLEGAIEGVRLYAVWRNGEQLVGLMELPLEKVLQPYKEELVRLTLMAANNQGAARQERKEPRHALWQALADACNVPLNHFKTAGEFIDHVQKLNKELAEAKAEIEQWKEQVAASEERRDAHAQAESKGIYKRIDLQNQLGEAKTEIEMLKQVNADFDKAVAEVAAFKANDGSVTELVRLRIENDELKQVLNQVLLECAEPSSQDIHAEPWIPDELGDLIRQKLRSSKT